MTGVPESIIGASLTIGTSLTIGASLTIGDTLSFNSCSLLNNCSIMGFAVSYVLYFAYLFISAGTKLSKKSCVSKSCNTIISSSRKLYFTCPNDKYD